MLNSKELAQKTNTMTALKNPSQFIRGLEKTDDFLVESDAHEKQTRALASTALKFSARMEERASDLDAKLDAYSVRLIGQLPDFFEGKAELDIEHKEGENWDREHCLEQVIPFNHTIRSMIDEFPELKIADLRKFCTETALILFGASRAKVIDQMVFETIGGMLQEIGLKQIAKNIDGVTYVKMAETVEEETKGIDLIVGYYGCDILLDAKSSHRSEEEALEEQLRKAFRSDYELKEAGYPIYTGALHEDFEGGFRLSQEATDRCTPRVKEVLELRRYALLTRKERKQAGIA